MADRGRSLFDHEIEVSIRVRFVAQLEMPPFGVERLEAMLHHGNLQQHAPGSLPRGDFLIRGGRTRIEKIVARAHIKFLARIQRNQSQIDRRAPGVARPFGDIALREQLRFVHMGEVERFCPVIFQVRRPADEMIHRPLRTIAVEQFQTESNVAQFPLHREQGLRRFPRQQHFFRPVAIDGGTDEIASAGVARLDLRSGEELAYIDEARRHLRLGRECQGQRYNQRWNPVHCRKTPWRSARFEFTMRLESVVPREQRGFGGAVEPMQVHIAESAAELKRIAPVLLELRDYFGTESLLKQIELQQRECGYRLAYVEEGGAVLAVAGFVITRKLAWRKHLYVDDLVTATANRSRGAGRRLIEWLRCHALEQGCEQLHLDSGVQRFRAHRFYLREGFDINSHHFAITELQQEPPS